MKRLFSSILAAGLLAVATNGMAWWDDDDYYGGPWGHDWNPYDEWDPRYWMEEMEDIFDDDDDWEDDDEEDQGLGHVARTECDEAGERRGEDRAQVRDVRRHERHQCHGEREGEIEHQHRDTDQHGGDQAGNRQGGEPLADRRDGVLDDAGAELGVVSDAIFELPELPEGPPNGVTAYRSGSVPTTATCR